MFRLGAGLFSLVAGFTFRGPGHISPVTVYQTEAISSKGVSLVPRGICVKTRPNSKRYRAQISCRGHYFLIGTYRTEVEAAEAYDHALLFLTQAGLRPHGDQLYELGNTRSGYSYKPPVYNNGGPPKGAPPENIRQDLLRLAANIELHVGR